MRSVAEALSGQSCCSCWTTASTSSTAVESSSPLSPSGCRAYGVLTTSRTTLHVPGEYVVRLQPWPLPVTTADLSELARQPAVQAFLELRPSVVRPEGCA